MKREIYITENEGETRAVAEKFGEVVSPGDILCLKGDLGVGKTVFAKGICSALGVKDYVSSPTFTLVNEYEGESFPVYHFDLYRIEEPDELYAIGFDDFLNGEALVLIEWPECAGDALPKNRLEITLERDGEDRRKITVEEVSA